MTTQEPHGPAAGTTSDTSIPSATAVAAASPWPTSDPQLCECGCGEPAPIATRTDPRFGYVKGQPVRYIHGHKGRQRARAAAQGTATHATCACGSPVVRKKAKQCRACYERSRREGGRRGLSEVDRFMAKVGLDNGDCWTWNASMHANGYGIFFTNKRKVVAHRWSYAYHRAEIPAGLDLDHLCRNRACVNPWHLEPVTKAVNSLRGEAPSVQLWRKNRCARGHDLTKAYIRKDTGGRMCRECERIRLAKRAAADPDFKAKRAAYERNRRARSKERP